MRPAWPRVIVVGTILAVSAAGVAGCGSSSSSSSPPSSGATSSGPAPRTTMAARAVAHALVVAPTTPPVSAAECRLESAAQRTESPFGSGGPPVYSCSVTRSGAHAAFDVQVLANGCFVAERRAPGAAIYGCGGPE